MTDQKTRENDALELAALGWHVIIVQPENKRPYKKSNGYKDATRNREVIESWFMWHPEALVAVIPGLSGKTVLDFDTHVGKPNGFETASRENLPTDADVSGASFSGSGKHLWFDGATERILGIYPGIDRLSGPSYVVVNYELPAPEDVVESLPPQFSIDRAAVTDRPFEGELNEWLAAHTGDISYSKMQAVQSILAEPFTGHARMIEVQRGFVMAAGEGEPGMTDALGILRDHWLSSSHSSDEDPAQEWDVALAGAIQKYGAQVAVPPFASADEFQHHISRETWSLSRSDATLEAIIASAKKDGASDHIAASVAWASPAGKAVSIQPDGRERIWNLVVATPTQQPTTVANDGPLIPLLHKRERTQLADPKFRQWFGEDYMAWAEKTVRAMNPPYHRMNRWTILQLNYMPHGILAQDGGINTYLNLYTGILGPTTSGKSEAWRLLRSVIKECSWLDGSDIGGNATAEALIKKLIERDGEPTMFRRDEFQEFIRQTKNEAPFRAIPGALTEVYDGDVGAILRSHDKETSGVNATALLTVHATGVLDEMTNNLEGKDWETGWMNRFVWAIGEKREIARDERRLKLRKSQFQRTESSNAMQATWSAQFAESARVLDMITDKAMTIGDDVLERHVDLMETLEQFAARHRHAKRLIPTFTRLAMSVMKAACLVCLSEAHLHRAHPEKARQVTMRHFLIALEQAEEWAANAVTVVDGTDETLFVRDMKRLLAMVQTQPGSAMEVTKALVDFGRPRRQFDDLLADLEARRWIERFDDKATGSAWVRAIEGSK